MIKVELTVREMLQEDCWKDMARVPGLYRGQGRNRIRRNKICKVTIGNKHKLLAIRGCHVQDAIILLDSSTRTDLGVDVGRAYEVELRRVGWWGYWRWAWNAADPAYRIPSQISMISLILGIIGLILGILPFVHFNVPK